jgi:hypothetical protein
VYRAKTRAISRDYIRPPRGVYQMTQHLRRVPFLEHHSMSITRVAGVVVANEMPHPDALSISIANFTMGLAGRAGHDVKAADTNHDHFITGTEVAALPKNLQDNYAHYAAIFGDHVDINAFLHHLSLEARLYAELADLDGDGRIWMLGSTESQYVPERLRDNLQELFSAQVRGT